MDNIPTNMHTLNNSFDKVVCINLLERKDRFEKATSEFIKFGINVEWFHPVKYGFNKNLVNKIMEAGTNKVLNSKFKFSIVNPNEIGCAISHYTVIKTALLEGCNNLFVFEDDITLDNDFNNKFNEYYNALPPEWDMILLYSWMRKWGEKNKPINSIWKEAHDNWSNVAYGINRNFMENYINSMDNFFTTSDQTTLSLQEKMKCYVADKFLVTPDFNSSDIR